MFEICLLRKGGGGGLFGIEESVKMESIYCIYSRKIILDCLFN